MTDLISEVKETYRDFVTDGVPASGANEPDKAEIRTLLVDMATAITASQQGMTAYATAADLPTDPVPADGTQARVYADSTDSNNGVWLYSSGAWAFDTDYYDNIAAGPLAAAAAAQTNSNHARWVVDGRIISFKLNGDGTATISTTQGRVWAEYNNETSGSTPIARVNPVTVTLSGSQGLLLDLDSTPDGSGYLTPTVSTITANSQSGWQTGRKIVLFSLSAAGVATSDTDESKIIYGGGAYHIDAKTDPSMLQILQTPGVVKIMQKSSNPNSAHYTRWALVHKTDVGTNCDIWHNEGLWDSVLLGGKENKLQALWRTTGAEMETAVSVNSTTTFSGGYAHRYQKMKTDGDGNPLISMFIDGVKKPIDDETTVSLQGRVVDVYMTSELYFNGTDTVLADVYTHWRWTRDRLLLEVTFDWQASAHITYAYTGILPTYRTATVGPLGGEQSSGDTVSITDSGIRSPFYQIEDLSTDEYTETTSDSANAKLWGAAGYCFETNFLSGWDDATRQFRFAPDVQNKPYHSFIHDKDVTAADRNTLVAEIIAHNPN